ncbi:hypothetical protein AKJ18_05415, partial [Vibrio xuii]
MSDFVFLSPYWLIASLPWFAFIVWLSKRASSHTLIAPHLAKVMGVQAKKSHSGWLSIMALSGLIAIVALAGPSFKTQELPSYANSSARVLVMDMSMSMYANDIKPNRLTQARYKAIDLLENWKEGSTGLVAYAGDAYQISPMTSDSQTITNLLPNLSPELMPYPGADASKGIELAINMMTNTGLATGDIVLITDDIDDTERSAIETLLKGTDWRLSILGVGTRSGAPIQLNDGTLMTHTNGQPVVAKSNFDNMRALASTLNGQFIPVQVTNSDVERITQITSALDGANAQDSSHKIAERVNQGFWLLPLLIIPALLLFRRGVFLSVLLLGLPLISPKPAFASPWINNDQQAKQLFDQGKFADAAEQFTDQQWKGISQYQNQNYSDAIETLKNEQSLDGRYNLANAYAQNGQLDEAAEIYQEILKQDPQHQDAKQNLEVVKQAQQQQQQ